MKRLLLILLLLTSAFVQAQYRWDYGVKLGAANYLGDIGGKNLQRRDYFWDMHLGETRYAVGIFGRYKYNKRFALAGNLDHFMIQDADRFTTYIPRRTRNMNFRNRMFELGARAEFTLWYDNDVGNRGFYNPDFKLYAFAGLSFYYSNPQAKLVYDPTDGIIDSTEAVDLKPGDFVDNTWYNLRQLRTEGATYSAVGLAIPMGIGFYFTYNKEWRFGWEVSWRKTFSDYLDDVSTYYNKPDPEDPRTYDLALALQSQTYAQLLDEQNELLAFEDGNPVYEDILPRMSLNDFRYQPGNDATEDAYQSSRGLHDPANPLVRKDNYITTQVTISRVIRGRSKFYRSKYSWVKNRSTVKRSRGKF